MVQEKKQKDPNKARNRRETMLAIGVTAMGFLAALLYPTVDRMLRPGLQKVKKPEGVDILAVKADSVPLNDPDSPLWSRAPATDVQLADQTIVKPFKTTVPKEPIKVRAAYDNEWVGFLLEWKDASADKSTIKLREFRDACAVLLAKHPAPPEVRFMGTKDIPATILHWKADWQLDIEEGFQDLEKAFPNVSADVYPPMKEAVVSGKPPKTLDYPEYARIKLAGWAVGNPISQPTKQVPIEKILAVGPGTIATAPTQDATGWGTWKDGVWRVILAKKLKASDSANGEVELVAGDTYTAAFTIWYGNEGDRGARKNPSMLQTVYLQ